MFVVVAVEAQQFPVASVGRIEIVVVVAVMDSQLMAVGVSEFTCAAPADPRVHFHRLLAIAKIPLVCSTYGVCDDAIETGMIGGFSVLWCHVSRPRFESRHSPAGAGGLPT